MSAGATPTPTRRRLGPITFLGALAAVIAIAVVASARHEEPTPSNPGRFARYFAVPGGTVAVDAWSDSHRLMVFWRDEGESVWSKVTRAYSDDDRYAIYLQIRVAGSTIAMHETVLDNDVSPDDATPEQYQAGLSEVFAVCKVGVCTASERFADAVLFGTTGDDYVVWADGVDIHRTTPTGLPGDEVRGRPLIAPDGSFRVVTGMASGTGCTYTLFTSDPGSVAFAPAVSSDVPDEQTSPDCSNWVETFSDDYVIAHTGAADPLLFERDGSGWVQTAEDPSGLVYQPSSHRRPIAGSAVRAGFWHWREVVVATPDGHQLYAQFHFPGEETWRDAQLVATAPHQWRCFEIAPTPDTSDEPFFVTFRCREENGKDAEFVMLTALTEDARTWQTFTGDDLPTKVDDGWFFGGHPSHTWTPDDGLQEVPLAVPDTGKVTQVEGGTAVLTTVTPMAQGCAFEVRIAESGDSEWSEPIKSAVPYLPDDVPCELPQVQSEGEWVSVYLHRDPTTLPARIIQRGGTWVVEDERPVG